MNYTDDGRPPDIVDEHVRRWSRELAGLDPRKEEILARMDRVRRRVDQLRDSRLRDSGLAGWQFKTLVMLRREGPPYEARPSQLAELLGVTRGALSNRLTTLERLDLVERTSATGDRRGVTVRLTAEGLRRVDALLDQEELEERALLGPLSEVEMDELLRLLRVLSASTIVGSS